MEPENQDKCWKESSASSEIASQFLPEVAVVLRRCDQATRLEDNIAKYDIRLKFPLFKAFSIIWLAGKR